MSVFIDLGQFMSFSSVIMQWCWCVDGRRGGVMLSGGRDEFCLMAEIIFV